MNGSSLNKIWEELTAQVYQAKGGYFFVDEDSLPWEYPTA